MNIIHLEYRRKDVVGSYIQNIIRTESRLDGELDMSDVI